VILLSSHPDVFPLQPKLQERWLCLFFHCSRSMYSAKVRGTTERLEMLSVMYKDDKMTLQLVAKVASMRAFLANSAEHSVLLEGIDAILELLLESSLNHQELRRLQEANEVKLAEMAELLATDRSKLAKMAELLATDRSRLAARQVLHNFNEKVLRKLIEMSKLPEKVFWGRFKVSNFGAIERHPDLMAHWPSLLKVLDLPQHRTPRDLWEELKFGKTGLDEYVHVGSYDALPYDQLKAQADTIFSGNLEKGKETFLEFLDHSVKLGGDLYV
ncbi:hypothetical protein Agub_g11794, partial [Astrephomene gubernaculifera]